MTKTKSTDECQRLSQDLVSVEAVRMFMTGGNAALSLFSRRALHSPFIKISIFKKIINSKEQNTDRN